MRRLATAILAAAFPFMGSAAAQFSAWRSIGVDGAAQVATSHAAQGLLVVLREGKDPVRSADGGLTWTTFLVNGQRPTRVQIAPTRSNIWYAVAGDTLYRSEDAGLTWAARSSEFPPLSPFTRPTYTDFRLGADPDLLYAVRQESISCPNYCFYSPGRASISTDGGRSWRGLEITGIGLNAPGGVYPSPIDREEVHVDKYGTWFQSTDQGASWKDLTPQSQAPGRPPQLRGPVQVSFDRQDPRITYLRSLEAWGPLVPGQPSPFNPLWITRDRGATWEIQFVARGITVADPLQAGRAYAFGFDGSVRETRDAGRTWVLIDMGTPVTSPSFYNYPHVEVVIRDGRRVAIRATEGKLEELDLSSGALALGSDIWWNPAESGMGYTVTLHGSRQAFVVWYAYDSSGAPVWRVVPGGTWNDRTFTGQLFETTGAPWFSGAFDLHAATLRPVGSVTLAFDDQDNARFSYRLDNGQQAETRITRQRFGPEAAPITTHNYADLWWNAGDPGWGIAINHQHNTIFATWFVYGDDGQPLWVVMPDARMTMTMAGIITKPYASGDVYTARGPASSGPFDPSLVVLTKVGTASFTFDRPDEALLEYQVHGLSNSRRITRQPF